MSRDVNMTAAFEEGIKARESHYSKYSNPYLVSHLRAAWNRGWDSGTTIPGQDQAQTEDTHGHTWDLAESSGELVGGEVAKEVGGHASSLTSMHGNIRIIYALLGDVIDCLYLTDRANREWLENIEERTFETENALDDIRDRAASRIRNLQQSSIDTKQELATINQRIADVETTLERLEGDDCEYVPGEVSKALESIGDALDDYSPPAAGPWQEGLPPDDDMNKWLVTWGKHVFMLEEIDDNRPNITHHARIYKPEATDD